MRGTPTATVVAPAPIATRITAALVAVVLAVLAVGSPVAGAQNRQSVGVGNAVVALQSEVLALVELRAFAQPVGPRLQAVHDEWASYLDGVDRAGVVAWAESADQDGAVALNQLLDDGVTPTPELATALGHLSIGDEQALDDGTPISLSPGVYAHALDDLDRLGAGRPAAPRAAAPRSGASPTVAPTTQVSATSRTVRVQPIVTGPRTGTAAGAGTSTLWIAIMAAALLTLGAAAATLFRRRRDTGRPGPDRDSVNALLDAARRLGPSLDASVIAAIAVDEARALTGADHASYVPVDDPHDLDRGAVRRVVETGQPFRSIVTEPEFGAEPVAVIAVPVVRSGRVIGGLSVTRPADDGEFGPDQQDLLSQLATLVAGALDAASVHDDLTELSLTDGLTSLANRRRLDRDLTSALADGRRQVGFLMIDIDHFKAYNDANGHVAGDIALRKVADILAANARPDDVVYRYGGEEFCVLLADAPMADAVVVAERLRAAVEAEVFDGAESQPGGRVTISVGLTVADRVEPGELKQRADGALYAAKHGGRNRVEVSPG